ncbi:SWI/SNF-related matrix-associated actin-dependent regulator of chromatin subfamily D [Nematocida homosporus]|uniref:SWI/SNF-related matrix-associated actin-dependent regulator of chromatin subfamily D n=1 Tax=Nematocida homosporus TaxID=1912981 RepID=UPI00221F02AA|nr:SWI/SNF-related matrix-associated actin-dependent regulator of chromatin subfamily D [Nematocida homosporus]KAI5184287.1 SWI/SNF-related matrix-associated actin-dependent regulator of chromatin subfamily D [Nematocida homosporus]
MLRSDRLKSLFESLLLTEKRLDQAITKKKMRVEEAHFKKIKKAGIIRLNIVAERVSEEGLFILIGGKIRGESVEEGESEVEPRAIGSVIKKLFVEIGRPRLVSGLSSCLSISSSTSISSDSDKSGVSISIGIGSSSKVDRDISSRVDSIGSSNRDIGSTNGDSRDRDMSGLSSTKGDNVSNTNLIRTSLQSSEDSSFFEWHNSDLNEHISEFEIKTKTMAEKGKVFLDLISYTGKYQLCQPLAEAVGIPAGSRPVIFLAIWKYITAQKMKDPKRPKIIICNDLFQRLFGAPEISFEEIINRLDEYLSPLELICIEFTIPPHPGQKAQSAYDITVELDPVRKEYAYSDPTKLAILDKKISDILVRLDKQEEKIKSLNKFINDPKHFITDWILESSKNLHLITDDLYEVSEGFYIQKEVQECVYQLLQNYK